MFLPSFYGFSPQLYSRDFIMDADDFSPEIPRQ